MYKWQELAGWKEGLILLYIILLYIDTINIITTCTLLPDVISLITKSYIYDLRSAIMVLISVWRHHVVM